MNLVPAGQAGRGTAYLDDLPHSAMTSSFASFNEAFMLSGFTFRIRQMPEPVQYLIRLNSVR
jgi:hypothetical protein